MAHYLLAFAFALFALSASADDALPQQLPPDQEAAAIGAAETRGLAIYRHDRAASVATDAGLRLRAFKKDKRISGWITEQQQDQIVVTFIDETPAALYRIPVSEDGIAGPVTALDSPVALTRYESGAAAARSIALSSRFEPCSKNYNSVILPAADVSDDRWCVYLFPGTTKNDVVPIGGTYRMQIEGTRIAAQRGFTLTCIALPTSAQAGFLMITHLLDPVPTEAHVFWSLWAGKSMYVATAPHGTVWGIASGEIALIDRKSAEK